MTLEWTPRPAPLPGSWAEVEHKGKILHVRAIPGVGGWLGISLGGMVGEVDDPSFPTEEAARAAVEEAVTAFLAPKKRGPKPGRTVGITLHLPTATEAALRAKAKTETKRLGRKVTPSHVAAEILTPALLAALPVPR